MLVCVQTSLSDNRLEGQLHTILSPQGLSTSRIMLAWGSRGAQRAWNSGVGDTPEKICMAYAKGGSKQVPLGLCVLTTHQ